MQDNPQSPVPSTSNLRRVLAAFHTHKRKLTLFTLLSWTGAVLLFIFYRPPYVSEAKLMIIYATEMSDIDGFRPQQPGAVIRAELDLLTSREIAENAVKTIGADRLLEGNQGANPLQIVEGGLAASAEKGSNVIRVTFRHSNAETTQATLEAVIDRYLRKHKEIHRTTTTPGALSAKVEEGLMNSNLNISIIQHPTPGTQDMKRHNEFLSGLVAGGPLLGMLAVIAFGRGKPASEKRAAQF